MKYFVRTLILAIMFLPAIQAGAHIDPERNGANITDANISFRSDCAQSTSQIDMNINNVRARLLNGGDVWWDLQQGKYIVPNVDPASGIPEVSSIFAGAVWIGGYDDVGNLKMAAQDYRNSTQTDFWPGPLTNVGTTAKDTCLQWDRFFKVLGENIRTHIRNYVEAREAGIPLDCESIPEDIRGWPGKGNPYFFEINGWTLPFDTQGLGAFHDEDKDGLYDPCLGDYPIIEVRGCPAPNFPDEMIFWIYNDAGNIHTNSQGEPIKMEVQVQAFAYSTNDELNDMTFQRYKLINRATSIIDSCFFAMWVDADLGCHTDDYIGCDTARSLMYIYNEDELDGTTACDCPSFDGPVNTYCREVPILGVDYFRGPRAPAPFCDTVPLSWEPGEDIISIESDMVVGDSVRFVCGEKRTELGMSSFTYYMNGSIGDWPNGMTDPQAGAPLEFYRYISGSWRDGQPFTYGGSGYSTGPGQSINYAFTEPPDDAAGWSMCTANLNFGDRRTLQTTGPLRLDPGEVNELIIGAVWVPDIDYPCPDISRLLFADRKAQALFDNCFILPDGPDAPDMDFIELDRQLVLILSNDTISSNNAFEAYAEKGLDIPEGEPDSLYTFEGYKVYQLAGPEVGASEVNDIEKARLIIQVDKKNGVNTIYNWTSFPDPNSQENEFIWIPEERVQGDDEGVRHTFQILEDQFGSEDRRLVNHKKYYFLAVAYAHNDYLPFDSRDQVGQTTPYLEGRRNIQIVSPIPRPITYLNENSFYGEGPNVWALSGVGAGANFLDISDSVRNEIATFGSIDEILYEPGASPIDVKVFDPLRIVDGRYILEFYDNAPDENLLPTARWRLYPEDNPSDVVYSERSIASSNEQIIYGKGFSVNIGQTDDVGDQADETNGAIGATVEYADPNLPQWFLALPDGQEPFNYIRTQCPDEPDCDLDPNEALSQIGSGFFTPYQLCNYRREPGETFPYVITPAWLDNGQASVRNQNGAELQALNNVDIVLTSNKDLWSRCVVVETSNFYHYQDPNGPSLETEGGSRNMEYRNVPSVGMQDADNDGKADPDGELDENGNPLMGMGWFPGYAVDVETGKRLNIFFGEASIYTPELQGAIPEYPANGNDMIWNPNADPQRAFTPSGGGFPVVSDFSLGAMHYIYVTHEEYDGCAAIQKELRPGGSLFNKWRALPKVTWTAIPLMAPGEQLLSYNEGLIPNDVTIKLRVDNPYAMTEDVDGNYEYPTYRIEFRDAAPTPLASGSEVNEALAQINVVPNPYYAYSSYETSQFSNIVKITNLPAECTVTIFSTDGRFIRQYKRNESGIVQSPPRANPPFDQTQIVPDLEWDIRNHAGIPVASGVYIIHVDAPGLGERIIKWFGVNRKFDPSGL